MITIDNLSKSFQSSEQTIHALNQVSLQIQPHEIFGVIGASGAGKSTLIRCLNLLEIPDEGSLSISGSGTFTCHEGQVYCENRRVREKDLQKLRKNIGMVFQHFNLLERKTVSENIAYALKNQGYTRKEIQNRVTELLELVGLPEKADSYPSQLSGGQKQRIGIARAIAPNPEILLCDEATSALDPEATVNILHLLARLNKQLGLTIILITHEMSVIKSIAHQVAVMENGHIVEQGNVYDLFSHPHHPLTRKFVGQRIEEEIALDLGADTRLLQLHFDSRSVKQPLISQISQQYSVELNILQAHIDRIQQESLGSMLVSISGEEDQIEKTILALRKGNVEVEEVPYA